MPDKIMRFLGGNFQNNLHPPGAYSVDPGTAALEASPFKQQHEVGFTGFLGNGGPFSG